MALVVMKTANEVTAGVLYLMLAAFALAVLGLLLSPPPPFSWSLLVSTPDALVLSVTLVSLALISRALATILLWWRPKTSLGVRTLKITALALPIIAFGWNVLAPLFWLVPLAFTWRVAGEAKHDD